MKILFKKIIICSLYIYLLHQMGSAKRTGRETSVYHLVHLNGCRRVF